MSDFVSRSMRGVLPYRANAIASRIDDFPLPIGPTMPTRLRSAHEKVASSA
jgi:hypothetical protein